MTATLAQVVAALTDADIRAGAGVVADDAPDDVGLPGSGLPDVGLHDVTHDSRQVGPGTLFCAVIGSRADGHDHAPGAVADGAAALLVERWLDIEVPQVRVPSVRAAMGPASAVVHGHPSRELRVVGITGTNGKTTTAYLLESAFAAAGVPTGVIGTVETRILGRAEPGVRTTPEGTDLQRLLRAMHTRGADAVAMEVSSHGLAMHRVDGTRFAVAVFTNLSRDHLDFHGTMEAYFAAKARLFTPAFTDRAVVHLDGPWGRRLCAEAEVPITTVGRDPDADVRLVDVHLDVTGGRGRLLSEALNLDVEVATRLAGAFNLDNAATAVTAAVLAGVPVADALRGIAACPGAPGRLERVEVGQDTTVLVDYAHTPDAVVQVLATVRALLPAERRLVVVLGCGGDRDRDKRGPMGAAAAAGADEAVLTSDNPRSEDPRAILDAVVAGARTAQDDGAAARLHVELDRRAAIALALELAGPGDAVVIAGKGHETGQEIAGEVRPFDDRLVAAELLRAAGQAGDA